MTRQFQKAAPPKAEPGKPLPAVVEEEENPQNLPVVYIDWQRGKINTADGWKHYPITVENHSEGIMQGGDIAADIGYVSVWNKDDYKKGCWQTAFYNDEDNPDNGYEWWGYYKSPRECLVDTQDRLEGRGYYLDTAPPEQHEAMKAAFAEAAQDWQPPPYNTGGIVEGLTSKETEAMFNGEKVIPDVNISELIENDKLAQTQEEDPIEIKIKAIKERLPLPLEEAEAALEVLVKIACAARKDAGWDEINKGREEHISMTVDLSLIFGEVAEGLENVRRGCPPDKHLTQYSGITVELVDIILRVLGFAHCYNLPIAQALVDKIEYNARRPDHKKEARNAPGGKKY